MTVSKTELVLAIDFSLDHLDVDLGPAKGSKRWPHRRYENNLPGYEALRADLVEQLAQEQDPSLTVVGESTGPYWWHSFYQFTQDEAFEAYELEVVLLNPLHLKRFRKALPEQDKTDLDDPGLIARYYHTIDGLEPYQFDQRYLPLRFLSRAYCRLSHRLAAEKAYLHSLLFLTCSDYQRKMPFSDLFGQTSLHVLSEFDDIQAMADLPLEALSMYLDHLSKQTLPQPERNAGLLQEVARTSFPVPETLASTWSYILKTTIEQIRFLSDKQKALYHHLETTLEAYPEADLALNHPGLGPILVAGFLGEIQDTRRFTTGQKYDRRRKVWRPRRKRDGQAAVAKLAGLWWPKNDSGRVKAQDRHLARERNPYLRYWFIQAAHTLQRYDPTYRDYYRRKFKEAYRHHHKRALVLTARKAVRLVFALLHQGQSDWPQEVQLT